ncbi:MAG TPA: IPT/TIG domain-containing protein [Solirubrobacteraceae bacterium]|nr:IPT/TIG domain-containing protein [Solirubrobacteraceae bacterium]
MGLLVLTPLLASTPVAAGSQPFAPVQAAPRTLSGASATGAMPAGASLSGSVVLKPRDGAALQSFITAVSTPGSPRFHDYLPAGAFAARFGPTRATISAVRTQLRSAGLTVTGVSSDGLFVHFKGSASQVEQAFHTGLESYRLPGGRQGHATTSAVTVPSALSGSVAAVLGLNDLTREQPSGIVHAPASDAGKIQGPTTAPFAHPSGAPNACPAASSAARKFGGLTDDQIANAYGAFGLYGAGDLGAGQTIDIYELEPFLRSDVKTFDTCYFGAAQAAQMMSRLKVTKVDGGLTTGPGSGEAILDVEDVSALAPDAKIDVFEGPSYGEDGIEYDPIDEYLPMVESDQAHVISSSWGLCEQAIQLGQPGLQEAENLLFEQAAAQGQSIFSAAGDTGEDTCNELRAPMPPTGQNPVSVGDPASQPYVVGVGGTTITDAATSPAGERVWNDGAVGGAGGGGISQSWAMPSWQRAATVPGIALPGSPDYTNANNVEQQFGYAPGFCQNTVAGATSSTPCRLVPDVSAQADEYTGAVTIYAAPFGGWLTIGGTSSATPIWAALVADVNASSTCASQPATRDGVGFISPLLYAIASDPSEYAASFNDITTGNNDLYTLDNGLVFPARTGYDEASGLGSPRLTDSAGTAGLAFYLCNLAASGTRPTVSALSPAQGSTAGGEKVTITGSGFKAGGSSDVASVEVGTARLSSSQFTVNGPGSMTVTMPPAVDTQPPDPPAPQDGAGPAQVIVTLADDESSAPGASSMFEYVDTNGTSAVPSITGVVPIAGAESAPAQVTILGSGFTGASKVTFGGVAANTFTVRSANEIIATPPAYSSATACVPLPSGGAFSGENASNDICQTQVRVTNTHGTSKTGTILPPPEGAFAVNSFGVQVLPPGCDCELQPAPTEYDYVPEPSITSVSTSDGPSALADENGGTVITIQGVGFDPMTIDSALFGPPTLQSSVDESYVYTTGTEIQIVAPAQALTVSTASVPLRIRTLAGTSAPVSVSYAGVPQVSAVTNTTSSTQLNGVSGAPVTGGTPLQITGKGFAGQLIAPIIFGDAEGGGSIGTQYTFTVVNDTTVDTQTDQQNAGLVDVRLCTVTGCSLDPPADELWLYQPGDPTVNSVTPSSGPASGGTHVTIGGQNLGCPIGVFFGTTAASSFKQVPADLLDCGSTTQVKATSPPGTSGHSVPVTVETVESYFTGSGHGTTTADFTYK